MSEFFASGHAIDLVLALVGAEIILLFIWRRWGRNGPDPIGLLPNILAGASLMLALRFALTSAWWGWIALCLILSLLAHLFDLKNHWRK